jgi:hypothetical protein
MVTTKLYKVTSYAEDFRGYKNVPLTWFVDKRPLRLFGAGGSLGVPYSDVIRDYDGDNRYAGFAEMALEGYFTEVEATALVEWLRVHRNNIASITPVKLPIESNTCNVSSIAMGGETDFLMVGKSKDYDLPFKAWAYFDVRGCDPSTHQ